MRTETINFQVTQKDIDNGRGGDCGFCAVALAVSRKLKTPMYVGTASFQPTCFSMDSVLLPREIVKFIRAFDTQKTKLPDSLTEPLEPIRFSVDVPVKWLETFVRKHKGWLATKKASGKKGTSAISKTTKT